MVGLWSSVNTREEGQVMLLSLSRPMSTLALPATLALHSALRAVTTATSSHYKIQCRWNRNKKLCPLRYRKIEVSMLELLELVLEVADNFW
jgi:hypothetical protein